MTQPKKNINCTRLRNASVGWERRHNMAKKTLDNGTPFPKSVDYKDIDLSFKKFVEDSLDISYDGKRLPTFTLFSNQRIGEYSQTWNHKDDMDNILMNFKTVNRDNNPQKGKIYGDSYNIPSNINFAVYEMPALQANGQMGIDRYSMKQPMPIDFVYTVNIITNKYELLNEFNKLVQEQFKSLQCYIFPNEHAMSMTLESVSDETSYNIDDRKFYSQAYKITLKGYIIQPSDFKIEHLPGRVILSFEGDKISRKHNKWKNVQYDGDNQCKYIIDDDGYYHQVVRIRYNFSECSDDISYTSKVNFIIDSIELHNIYDFVISVNGECFMKGNFETLEIMNGDSIRIKATLKNNDEEGVLYLWGYDKEKIVNVNDIPESALDDEQINDIHAN